MNEAKPCDLCGRKRLPKERDYTPLDIFEGRAGWYSAPDGTLCSDCMTTFLEGNHL